MWREPKLHQLDVPKEYKDLINSSIYFNRKGKMREATTAVVLQYIIALLSTWIIASGILLVVLDFLTLSPSSIFSISLITLFGGCLAGYYIYWGWYQYEEAWYHFDHSNEIFSVTMRVGENWEVFEIPYDTVDEVEFSGGARGYATIHAAGFKFDTTRMGTDRFASVTELWNNLARFDTNMTNWPITLICPKCDREFGHHIGTAQCPFDEMILIDPDVKGRIDPEEIHEEDIDRV